MTTFERERQHVGPGWWPIVDEIHENLTALLGDYDLHQIKEKFGELRYYMAAPAGCDIQKVALIRDIIDTGEAQSRVTCEECGQPGKTVAIRGWWRTLCSDHERAQIVENEHRPPSPLDPTF